MSSVAPVVRYLIICEDVQADPANPHRITIVGLLTAIRSVEYPPFPLRYREMCVFVQLTESRGPANLYVEIIHADSGQRVVRTKTRRVAFPRDPLEVHAVVFRITDLTFSEPGLYLTRFRYNEIVIAEQPVLLREP